MKKTTAILLIASLLLIPLSGCGDEKTAFTETVTISVESPTFTTDLYSVSFGPGVLTKDTEMTVSEVNVPPLNYEGESSKIYNFSLDKIETLTTISDFTIPFTPAEDEIAVAAYYDGTTWAPVNYSYDNGEVTIHSTLLGTFGAFAIKRAGVIDASMDMYYIPTTNDLTEKAIDFIVEKSDAKHSPYTASSLFCDSYTYALGIDINGETLENSGFDESYIDQYKEIAGNAGSKLAAYQIIHSIRTVLPESNSLGKLKTAAKKLAGTEESVFKQNIAPAIRAAYAYLDFCVTPYKELAPCSTNNPYKVAYDDYYAQGGNGYRDIDAWYRDLYSILADGYYEAADTTTVIKDTISKYTNAIWDDPKLLQSQKNKVKEKGYGDPGKVTKDIKKELVNELEGNLYNGFVKDAMLQAIKQLEQKAYKEYKDAFEAYCEYVYRNVSLTLYTSTSVDEFADCTVQFENLPKDAIGNVPPCTLNSNGEGTISFRVFSFIRHGLTPVLTITDDNGNTKSLTITLHVPNNEIDLCDAK